MKPITSKTPKRSAPPRYSVQGELLDILAEHGHLAERLRRITRQNCGYYSAALDSRLSRMNSTLNDIVYLITLGTELELQARAVTASLNSAKSSRRSCSGVAKRKS